MQLRFGSNKTTSNFTFLFFFAIAFSVVGQEKSDSLETYLQKAYTFYDQSDYSNSVSLGNKLLKKAYKEDNLTYVTDAYYLLGVIDESMLKYNEAKEKYNNALKVAEKIEDSLVQINIYNGLANIASLQKKYKEAENLYLKALSINEDLGLPKDKDVILNICWNYLDEKKPEKVTPYLENLKSFLSKDTSSLDEVIFQSDVNFILGRYYGDKNQFQKAHQYLGKAINLAETNQLHEETSQAYKANAQYYKAEGEFDTALSQTEQHLKYYKKQLDNNVLKKMQVERVKYDVNEYERKLEVSKKEKELSDSVASSRSKLNWLYLAICVLLTIFLIIIYKENQSKKKLISKLHSYNKVLTGARKEAEEAAEIKSNFISNISHELRTPLHGVVGITSLLLDEKNISEGNKELLQSLKFSGDYLLSLINNVLLMSKLNNNKVVVRPRVIVLKYLMKTIENSVDYSAKKNEVNKSFIIKDNVPEKIVVDPIILSEVLINLIENAIKFTKNGNVKTIVELSEQAAVDDSKISIRFSVIDDGIGIPEDKRKEIFQKFSQIQTDKDMLSGTGIGLSLVTNLLGMLNAKIELKSDVGLGSVFYFDLICYLPSTKEDTPDTEDTRNSFDGKRVLLVEDNEINKMVIRKFLSSYNIELEVISDGFMAFEALNENDYDLVLLDINIPSMNGYQVAEGVRRVGVKTPIVAVTASEYSEIEEKVRNAGIDDILIKPFQKKSLEELLDKFLN